MNTRSFYFLLVLGGTIGFLSACNWIKPQKKLVASTIEIRLDSAQNHLSLINFIDSLQVVVLESNNLSTLSGPSSIDKIIFQGGNFFLLDNTYAAIKVFDASGKYLYDIGKVGVKDGEFVRLDDMIYSTYKNSLLVLSNRPNKVTEFALDGKVLKTQRLRFFAHSMALLSSDARLFYANQNKSKLAEKMNLLFTDANNEIQERMFPMPGNFKSVIKFTGGIFSTNSGIYFTPALSSKYYLVSGTDTGMAIQVKYDAPQDYSRIEPQSLFNNLAMYKFQYSRFVRTSRYIGFNYMNKEYGSAFFNTSNKKLLLSDQNLDSLNTLLKSAMFQTGEHIILVFDRESKWGFLQRHKTEVLKRFPDFQKIFDTQGKNQNPVLLNFILTQ